MTDDLAATLARAAPGPTSPLAVDRIWSGGRRRRRLVGAARLGGSGLLVAACLAVALALTLVAGDEPAPRRRLPAAGDLPGWRQLPPVTVPAGATRSVWTGMEVLIWGPAGGVGYSVTEQTWRDLAPAPLSGFPKIDEFSMAWTGTELLVALHFEYTGMIAYDPMADTWRVIDDAVDVGGYSGAMLPMGNHVLRRNQGMAAVYDAEQDIWREAVKGPVSWSLPPRNYVWATDQLLVLGPPAESPADPQTLLAAYDPATDQWRSLAPPPRRFTSQDVAVWTGDELIVTTDGMPSDQPPLAYDAGSDRWRTLAAPPPGLAWADNQSAWSGTAVVLWVATPAVDPVSYEPDTANVRLLSSDPFPPGCTAGTQWTGRRLIAWCTDGGGFAKVAEQVIN